MIIREAIIKFLYPHWSLFQHSPQWQPSK